MKKIYTNLLATSMLLIIIGQFANAQPSLTFANSGFITGQNAVFNQYNFAAFNPGSSGANVTWNFASLASTANYNANIVQPSATPYSSSFTSATHALSIPSQNAYQYFYNNVNELSQLGIGATTGLISYSNRETFLTYPCTYNNQGNDNFSATFVSGGYTFYRYGTSSFEADGYGTLIMPYGTVNNVLRIHFTEDYVDSTTLSGFPYIIDYQNDQYVWMVPGTHQFLLSYFELIAGGNTNLGGYYINQTTGIDEIANSMFDVFPNPANDVIHVSALNNTMVINKISVFNSLGSLVYDESPDFMHQNFDINLAGKPAGMYWIKVQTNMGEFSRKIMLNQF